MNATEIVIRWRRYGRNGGKWRAEFPPGKGIDSGYVESSSLETVEQTASVVADAYGYRIVRRISEIQSRAADLIEKRGLCKETFVPDEDTADLDTCPLCVLAAFNAAVGAPVLGGLTAAADRAARAFADWLGIDPDTELIDGLGDEWNDRPEQTQASIVTQLRRCSAELARAGQ